MIQLKNIINNVRLITNMQFLFHQKPRSPSVPTQAATMLPFSINYLHNNLGARRVPPQVGRGPGSGRGKTSGRGHKGNKARQGGGVHVRFEGGQTPISRRLPKYGRVVKKRPIQIMQYVNLQKIVYYIQRNIINPNEPITMKVLSDCGLAKKIKNGVKILGRGAQKITFPLTIEATDASKSVIQAIQNAGGQIRLVHRTPLKLRQHLYPQKFPLPLMQPIVPAWKVRILERKAKHRGISFIYNKPKWMLVDKAAQDQKPKSTFIFPVPRIPNSGKIRQRKPKLYKKISYNI